MTLPVYILRCLDALEGAGFPAYAVGGCIRDLLLGRQPQDYDLCTAARPEEVRQIFSGYPQVLSGVKHGTVGVVTEGGLVEITTFRREGGYQDSRRPDWVEFVPHIAEDLARRDFTVNAMAYSPRRGLCDPFGGQADLQAGLLRTVGDPAARFTEDALRILRGLRFAAAYGLTIVPETAQAMLTLRAGLDALARERVFDELCRLLLWADAALLCRFAPILAQAVPELRSTLGFLQHSPHHAYDVFTHTAHVVESVPRELPLRWAALLHDVGKPAAFTLDEHGRGHFRGHAEISAALAENALRRLKAPAALREQAVLLVSLHMLDIPPDKKLLRRRICRYGMDTLRQLLALQRADFGGKGTGRNESHPEFDQAEALLQEIQEEHACLSLKDLAVSGHDLLALGYAPGRALGACLERLLTQVVDGELPNEKESLLDAAKRFQQEHPQM
ncbi:MAG TPA: HD domain-containing protein [Candidatus Faecousia intestinigallinarum]|nr:HD domain-containing protein [Candidatus Faecousia intestinigallinarum]